MTFAVKFHHGKETPMTQHFEQGASADAKEMSLHTKMRQSKLSVECANSKNDSFL